jgi:plasmid stabilization system protein ParE
VILELLPEAYVELEQAVLYYERYQDGVGARLEEEVGDLCDKIQRNPYLWNPRPGGFRRVNCVTFPYYIAFVIRTETIHIITICHSSRSEASWKYRLPDDNG